MRTFLTRFTFCVLLLAALLAFLMFGLVLFVQNNYQLRFGASDLVMGNSHPECAINDLEFHNLKNLSRSAEPLYYTHHKLKWLLKWNPQVRRVFIELSENQLESRMSEWIWSNESLQRQTLSLFPFLTFEHHLRSFALGPFDYIEDLLMAFKKTITGILLEDELGFFAHLDWGGFRMQKGSHLKESLQLNKSYPVEELLPDKDNLASLNGIINLCHEKNVEIIFIRCPIHIDAPRNFENSFQNFVLKHPQIELLDLKNYKLQDDCYFDAQHLNDKGADLFTAHFLDTIHCKNE